METKLIQKEKVIYSLAFRLKVVNTGSRRNEIVNQTWENIDFGRMMITIGNNESFLTKSKKNRIIPISTALADMLRQKF